MKHVCDGDCMLILLRHDCLKKNGHMHCLVFMTCDYII